MAGRLQSWMKKPHDINMAPPSAQMQPPQPRTDRESARNLKITSAKNSTTVNSTSFPALLLSTAPTPAAGYSSNYTGGRNTYPNQQYVLQQQQQNTDQYDAFDETVTSGFDDTRSDPGFHGGAHGMDGIKEGSLDGNDHSDADEDHDYDDEDDDTKRMEDFQQRAPMNQPTSQYLMQDQLKQSQSQGLATLPEQQHNYYRGQPVAGISGRFHATANPQWQINIADRSGNVPGQQINGSKKLGHSNKPVYDDDTEGIDQEELDDAQLPGPRDVANSHHPEEHEHKPGIFDQTSDGAESVSSSGSQDQQRQSRRREIQHVLRSRLNDPNRLEPDYDDDELKKMTYVDLKKETWETETHGQKRGNDHDPQDPQIRFEDRIEQTIQNAKATVQVAFFEQLSREEWEQCGDFFIDKFAGLMKAMKEARKKKREIITSFEAEIEAREKAVRGQSDSIEKKFSEMRNGGEGLLKDKMI